MLSPGASVGGVPVERFAVSVHDEPMPPKPSTMFALGGASSAIGGTSTGVPPTGIPVSPGESCATSTPFGGEFGDPYVVKSLMRKRSRVTSTGVVPGVALTHTPVVGCPEQF